MFDIKQYSLNLYYSEFYNKLDIIVVFASDKGIPIRPLQFCPGKNSCFFQVDTGTLENIFIYNPLLELVLQNILAHCFQLKHLEFKIGRSPPIPRQSQFFMLNNHPQYYNKNTLVKKRVVSLICRILSYPHSTVRSLR